MIINHKASLWLSITLLSLLMIVKPFDFSTSIPRNNYVHSVCYSPDGKYLALAQQIAGISIFSMNNNLLIDSTSLNFVAGSYGFSLAYSHDQRILAYSPFTGLSSQLTIINASNPAVVLYTINTGINFIHAIDFNLNDSLIILCGNGGFEMYQLTSTSSFLVQKKISSWSYDCTFSSNGQYAAVSNSVNVEFFYQNMTLKHSYLGGSDKIWSMDWNSDGSTLALVQDNKGLFICDSASNSVTSQYNASSTSLLSSLDWSPNDKYIAFSIKEDKTIILDAVTWKVFNSHSIGYNHIWELSFSPDSKYLAQARAGSTNGVWIYHLNVICALGSYNENNKCVACKLKCLVCDNSTCRTCSSGRPVGNGCTQVIGCVQLEEAYLNTTNNCQKCHEILGFELNSTTKTCQCPKGYSMNNNICHNIAGCLGPTLNQSAIQCQICDYLSHFQRFQHKCVCKKGYQLSDQTKQCEEVCGDGVLFQQDCDDGNSQDGDGCSSSCKVQKYHRCFNGSSTQASSCLYAIKKGIKMLLTSTDKIEMENAGIFQFQFIPRLLLLSKATVTELNFTAKGIQNVSWTFQKGVLSVEVDYNETLQGQQVEMAFILNNAYFRGALFYDLVFTVKSKGKPLVYQTQSQINSQLFRNFIFTIVFGIVLLLFVILIFFHKMAGVQFINIYQVIVYIFLLQKKITPLKTTLQLITFLNINYQSLFNLSGTEGASTILNSSLLKQTFPSFIYYGIVVIIFIILGLVTLSQCLSPQQITTIKDIFYNAFLFPFTMTFFYELYSLPSTLSQTQSVLPANFLLLISVSFMTIAILIISAEYKSIFFINNQQKSIYGMKGCKKNYVFWYIKCYVITLKFIFFVHIFSFQFYREILAAFFLILFIIFICTLPYKKRVHNMTQVTNLSVLVVFSIFVVVNHRMSWLTIKAEAFLIFVFIAVIAANVLINAIRIAFLIKMRCKRRKEKAVARDNTKKVKRQAQEKKNLQQLYLEGKKNMTMPGLEQVGIIESAIKNQQRSAEHQKLIKKQRKLCKQMEQLKLDTPLL